MMLIGKVELLIVMGYFRATALSIGNAWCTPGCNTMECIHDDGVV